jgi:hypothetical protein
VVVAVWGGGAFVRFHGSGEGRWFAGRRGNSPSTHAWRKWLDGSVGVAQKTHWRNV